MGKHAINKAYLKGCEKILRENGSKFLFMVALDPDGTVDMMKNIHNATEEDFRHAIKWMLTRYREYKEGIADDILKSYGL